MQQGGVLLVHSSYRAVRPVEAGPRGVVEALLGSIGPSGTLVMPSMTDWDDAEVFEARQTPCLGMGIIADTFWRMPDVLRSDSPHSFAAYGPRGGAITAAHPPDLPHGPDSPVGRVHQLDGQVLLLGVDHDANTTIHLAEFYADVPHRVPQFCAVMRDGVRHRIDYEEIDHCCSNFRLVGEWLQHRDLERRGQVGHVMARLARSRDVVATVVEELRGNPCRFLCAPATGCDECDAAWRSVSGTVAAGP